MKLSKLALAALMLVALSTVLIGLAGAQTPPAPTPASAPTVLDQIVSDDSALSDVQAKTAAFTKAQDDLVAAQSAKTQTDATLSATLATTGPVGKLATDSGSVTVYDSDGKGGVSRRVIPLAGLVPVPPPPPGPTPAS